MKHLPDTAALSRLFTAYPRTKKSRKVLSMYAPRSSPASKPNQHNMSPEHRYARICPDVPTVRSRPAKSPNFIIKRSHLNADVYDAQLPQNVSTRSLRFRTLIDRGIRESRSSRGISSPAIVSLFPVCRRTICRMSPVELQRIQRSFFYFFILAFLAVL